MTLLVAETLSAQSASRIPRVVMDDGDVVEKKEGATRDDSPLASHDGVVDDNPLPGSRVAPVIAAIDPHSVHRICSGQVILDLATAVKELIENSLDAGATVVEVRFRNYGADAIEIIDNGSGIDPTNHHAIVSLHPHHRTPPPPPLRCVRRPLCVCCGVLCAGAEASHIEAAQL